MYKWTKFFPANKSSLSAVIVFTFCLSVGGCSSFDFFSFGSSQDDTAEKVAVAKEDTSTISEKTAPSGHQHKKSAQNLSAQSTKSTKSSSKTSQEKSAGIDASESARIKKELDAFGRKKIVLINQGLRPNKTAKEVVKKNGMYVARYIEVHPSSLQTKFHSNTANPPVKYVGYLQYQETHYESKGATREKALNGPFSVSRVRNMTELILYDDQGWHD